MDVIRFHSKVSKVPTDKGCLLWEGCVLSGGYGQFYTSGTALQAHRVAYFIHNGSLSEDLYVCHECDVRRCCNPDHLWLGTHKDNIDDRQRKGRGRHFPKGDAHHTRRHPERLLRGEQNPMSKLREDDVRAIRIDNRSQKNIARSYGINQATVSEIKTFKIWRHVI